MEKEIKLSFNPNFSLMYVIGPNVYIKFTILKYLKCSVVLSIFILLFSILWYSFHLAQLWACLGNEWDNIYAILSSKPFFFFFLFFFSKAAQLCLTLCDSMDCPWNSPGQNTEVGNLSNWHIDNVQRTFVFPSFSKLLL